MNEYVDLARKTLDSYIIKEEEPKPEKTIPEKLQKKAGIFICLKDKFGNLKGCIGTFLPTKPNIAEEIIDNTIAAATKDLRFPAITKEEVPELKISVDILSEPELVENIEILDPKKFGILLKSDSGKTGLLLPDLEEVITVEQQIQIAAQKGQIDITYEQYSIYAFEVERHQ